MRLSGIASAVAVSNKYVDHRKLAAETQTRTSEVESDAAARVKSPYLKLCSGLVSLKKIRGQPIHSDRTDRR